MKEKSFTPFPVLKTERLMLRQLSLEDAPGIFTLRSDPAINQYLDRQPNKTLEDAIHFINRIRDSIVINDSMYWAITLTNTGKFVGTICLFDFSNEKNSCEIGYELLTEFQGQGIMKEAAEKVIEYAFKEWKVQKIDAFTHKDNLNSTKLLEKLDFKKASCDDTNDPYFTIYTLNNSFANV